MQKRIKPAQRHPVAGAKISLAVTRVIEVSDSPVAANQPKRGKLNYLVKPRQSQAAKAPPAARRRIERRALATGQYIGDGEKLTAFVWLDEDSAPQGEAANE